MRHIIIIITTLIALNAGASNLLQQADSAYIEDRYANAIELYEQVIAEEGTSTDIYYNLGNAYYRAGMLGKAIINYERALILDPTNDDAKTNLEFVNSKITDIPGDKGTFISNFFGKIINSQHSNTWAIYAMAAFILLLISIALYVFSPKIALKKTGFFGGIAFLLVSIILIVFSSTAHATASNRNKAVITSPSTILSTSPREPKDRSEEAMLLHEGTKVEILDSVTDLNQTKWYDVKVDNNHRAWLNSKDAEKI